MKNNRYFRHDWGARNDPKMLRLVRIKGAEAKAVYWDLVEMLYEEGGTLPLDVIEDIAFANHISPETARFVVLESGLFSHDENNFWSERQQRDEAKIKEISEKRRGAGKEGGIASGQQRRSKNEANAKQNGSKDEAINKIKEINNIDSSLHSESSSSLPPRDDSVIELFDEDIAVKPKDITPDQFKEMWNAGRGKLPKVATLTDDRKRKAKLRIAEFGNTPEEQTATITDIMQHIAASEFLQATWGKCNFDWLISNGSNWVKVIEGNYDNKKGGESKYTNEKWND